MPAPRKYTDTQRQAIFRLHEGGLSSSEIAEACAEGRTGLARFDISPRTVRDIIGKMEEEAHRQLPATVLDLEHGEAMERYPARAARILDQELDRLSRKQAKTGLTEKEIEMIPRLVASSAKVEKALRDRGKQRRAPQGAGKGSVDPAREESALEKLAREEREGDGREVHLSPTRSRPDASDLAFEDPATATGEQADRDPSADDERAASASSPPAEGQRAEAARKARAALAGVA